MESEPAAVADAAGGGGCPVLVGNWIAPDIPGQHRTGGRLGAGLGAVWQYWAGFPRYTELVSKTQNFYPAFALAAPVCLFASRCAKEIALKNAKKIANEIYIGNLHWKFALEIALEICIGNLHGQLH